MRLVVYNIGYGWGISKNFFQYAYNFWRYGIPSKKIINQIGEELKKEDTAEEQPTPYMQCPGSKILDRREEKAAVNTESPAAAGRPQLRQWPVQIMLVPENAPYFENADLLISADCVPFSYADFHNGLLKGKILLVGCPKLDDAVFYRDKISGILQRRWSQPQSQARWPGASTEPLAV